MLIDVHAHQFPDQYAQQMAQHGRRCLVQITPFVYMRDIIERVSTHPARLVLELTREWRQLRGDAAARSAA